MKRLAVLSILIIFLFGNPALADIDDGLLAYRKGDYETVLKEWRPLADQGNIEAQYNLAVMYQAGEGVIQDDK
jgi:TPR repeat protein